MTLVADERRETGTLAESTRQLGAVSGAQGIVASETYWLLALGAFGEEVPAALRTQAVSAMTMRDTGTRESLVSSLVTLDSQGPKALDDLRDAGLDPPDSVRQVLQPLSDDVIADLRDAHTTIDPDDYVAAQDWTQSRSGMARSAGERAQRRIADLAEQPSPWRDSSLLWILAVVMAGVVGTGITLRWSVLTAFRREVERGDELKLRNERLAALFGVVRSLSSSLDEDAVALAVVEQAVAATQAEFAVLARVAGDTLVPAATYGEVEANAVPVVGQGLVARTIDGAQPGRAVVRSEPLAGAIEGPISLAAAPLVAGGRVIAVVIAGTRAASLLDEEDESALSLVAMCAAPALDAARRHGSTAELALVDELTGLNNKRRLHIDLPAILAACAHDHRPVALAMIDVDHFKEYNDEHGHPAGDRALRRVAGIVRSCVREQDTVYRFGGEELAVLLPATHLGDAMAIAERIRASVALDAEPDDDRHLTVSVGVASTYDGEPESLLESADAALYRAKDAGRNRVEAADPGEMTERV